MIHKHHPTRSNDNSSLERDSHMGSSRMGSGDAGQRSLAFQSSEARLETLMETMKSTTKKTKTLKLKKISPTLDKKR